MQHQATDGANSVDKVLQTRLESVHLVLEGLKDLSADVTTARKGLDDLNIQIDEMGRLLSDITNIASTMHATLQGMTENMAIFSVNKNDDYLVKTEELQAQTDSAAELRTQLGRLRQLLAVDAWQAVRVLRRWSPLSERLSDRRVNIDAELRSAAKTLGAKVAAAASAQRPWAYYLKQVQGACDELFAQYVDLVGGIALRDQGFDRRVSQHADVLVALLLESFGGPSAMAVPSRHAPQALIQAQHVRIPLPPGWTLWSLPLAARGVGELLSRQVSGHPLLPDVFGTYVLGPAYAFAAILFELDPRDKRDQQRADLILSVLIRLDGRDDNGRFSTLAEEIRMQWAAASTASTAPKPRPSSVPIAPDDFDAMFEQVQARCEYGAYTPEDRWDTVESLSQTLNDLQNAVPALGGDLRDVLNAMWLARWRDPNALSTIDERATLAAERVTGTSGERSPGRAGGLGRTENR